ncbi:MAG: hypothetical protein EPN26_04255 [Rhodospirillales bacterium]|nr:MAG: hypothetical protein EPN26_04255 [Rhodospirillales bacterium]
MNKMLEKAIAELAKLPETEQEAYAVRLLDELEIERGWDERFAKTQDLLGEMTAKARAEAGWGGLFPFDPSNRPAR